MQFELQKIAQTHDHRGTGVDIYISTDGQGDFHEISHRIASHGLAVRATEAGKQLATDPDAAAAVKLATQRNAADKAIAGVKRDLARCALDREAALDKLSGEDLVVALGKIQAEEDALNRRVAECATGLTQLHERCESIDLDLFYKARLAAEGAIEDRRAEVVERALRIRQQIIDSLAGPLKNLFEIEAAIGVLDGGFKQYIAKGLVDQIIDALPQGVAEAVKRGRARTDPPKAAMSAPAGSSGQ